MTLGEWLVLWALVFSSAQWGRPPPCPAHRIVVGMRHMCWWDWKHFAKRATPTEGQDMKKKNSVFGSDIAGCRAAHLRGLVKKSK